MNNLNIWWLSQYASTPDQQFTTQYDLAKRLVQKGHRVTFFASGFSHYKFKEIRLQPGEMSRVEEFEGVRFVWIKTPAYNANNWQRVINMLAYAWRAYRLALKQKEAPDVIIGTTFHPLASLAAWALARAKRRPFIFEVKDLWPLTMVEFGRLSPRSPITRAMRVLEKHLARKSARIMTTLPGASDYYAQFGVPRDRIVWIPNGLELARYQSLKPYDGQISGTCTLVYAGGHVEAFPLDTILQAARIEQQNEDRVRFLFIGSGQEKPRLVRLAQGLELRNVEFRDAVPKTELYKIMEKADAFILAMRDLPGLYRYGISFNKLCDYVACGRPVLFAGSVSHNVVEDFECGIVIPPQDPKAVASAIDKFLSLTPQERAQMGRNGIRCARERFDIDILASRLEEMLLSVADHSAGSLKAAQESEISLAEDSEQAPISQATSP